MRSLHEALASAGIIENEANFANVLRGFQCFRRAAQRDGSACSTGYPKDAGGDCGKSDRCELQLVGNANRLAMATCECFRFAVIAAGPQRPDGVNHVARRQSAGCGGDGLSRGSGLAAPRSDGSAP